ncbi:MAG: hypothetical protein M3Y76_04905, partial [Chloroflexota bacterium]|nr:hypothetical protein [Chloroflexota bacterium]
MSNSSGQYTFETINHVFANLQPEDVEQFYTSYRQWLQQRQLADLHSQIATLRQQIVENNLFLQQTHPTPIALATLARLQSNGVTDLDLLDRMLERGEAWLDNTMQQLEYCEQFDFIRDGYSTWCEHALEGAYDWIDSMHKVQTTSRAPSLEAAGPTSLITPTHIQAGETLNEATEEVFLQKLMSEGDVSLIDTAIEIAVVSPMPREETPLSLVDQDTAQMQAIGLNAVLQAAQPLAKHLVEYHTPGDLPASGDAQQIVSIEEDATSSQLNETNAAPSVTTTASIDVEHDEMNTTSPAPAGTTNTNSTSIPSEPELVPAAKQPDHAQTEHTLTPIDKVDTVETFVTPHLPLEQVEPAEQREVEYKGAVAPAPAEETHPSHVSDSPNSPTVPEIPLAELSSTRDGESAAEQLNTTNDTPWHW